MSDKKIPTVKTQTLAEIMAELSGGNNDSLSNKTKKEIDKYVSQKLEEAVSKEVDKVATNIKQNIYRNTREIADVSFEDLKSKLEKDRMNTIQATSIVTIFIGFLVVQFNILQFSKSVSALAGLSLILLSSIIIFVLLIDLVIKLDLPYQKTKTTNGVNNSVSALANLIGGQKVKIPITWRPTTWGEGLKIRAVAMAFALVLMLIGIAIVSL